MMQRKHPSEAMTGATGALPGEAIRVLIQIVALHRSGSDIHDGQERDAPIKGRIH